MKQNIAQANAGWIPTLLKRCCGVFLLLACLFLMSGCSLVYRSTGDLLTGYSQSHAIPYLLTTDDPEAACALSQAFGPFLASFGTVTASPEKLKILMNMMSGSCAETQAWEAELRYLRALKQGNAIEAQDARIQQKRLLGQAAQRQYAGYLSLIQAMGEPGSVCPRFHHAQDELFWFAGLLSGLEAAFSDLGADTIVGVPLDTPQKVARGAQCLDNQRWWGMPMAIQAAVWAAVPGAAPEGEHPLQRLAEASALGLNQHVRLAQVLELQTYLSQGNMAEVKRVIRQHAQAKQQVPVDPAVKLFDEIATQQIQAVSDRLWTEAKGTRTPLKGLGTFWDDAQSNDDIKGIELNDL